MVADVDAEFTAWFNQHQPVRAVMSEADSEQMRMNVVQAIRREIKQAFTHGFARGVAAHASLPLEDHPELGPVR